MLRQAIKDEDRRSRLPTPTRALIQAVLRKEIADGLEALEGHVLEKKAAEGDEWKDIEIMALAACAFSGKGTAEDDVRKAAEMLCKIQNNSFQRFDSDLGVIGLFLEPTLAMANHSCIPNAAVQFIGRNALLIAENPIRAGDEVELAYTFYTDPLHRRREALAHYKFVCQCLRCRDNLNVYQVAAVSPTVNLNSQSLVSDVSKFRHHPAASNSSKQSIIHRYGESAEPIVNALAEIESPSERRNLLKSEYKKRKALVDEQLWAVTPLPDILFRISMLYGEEENFTLALPVACLIATACDPYQYTSPFHPIRLSGLFTIANFLTHTAATTAFLENSNTPVSRTARLEQKIEQTLREIDQVSLCQMLLILILKSLPDNYGARMDLAVKAQALLSDIEKLAGREQETSLINEWRRDPNSEKSQAFFEFAVVKQVDALASLGKEVLERDFGNAAA